jgi:hypothetical protein
MAHHRFGRLVLHVAELQMRPNEWIAQRCSANLTYYEMG